MNDNAECVYRARVPDCSYLDTGDDNRRGGPL
jgi:hypothetical protein